MLTVTDILLKMLLPLVAGIVMAGSFRIVMRPAVASLGRSCGVLTALLLSYFAHFALLNFAFADGETFRSKVKLTLSQTISQILNPSTAIQWLPIITTACLVATLLVAKLQPADKPLNHDSEGQKTSGSQRSSKLLGVFKFCLLFLAAAGTISRLLWSSVYFTDRFSLVSQIGYAAIPAIAISLIWLGGFRQNDHSQMTSRWTVVSTLVLSVSAMVLLGTSGSFSFALLQIPVIAAALVGFACFYPLAKRSPANHDAWLITSGICLPVLLGFFFAEVRWETAMLFALAAAMATWLTPKASDSIFKKAGITFLICLPAITAAIWAAIKFSQAVKSPYG